MDSTLRLLGIAYKAGRLAVGEEPVAAAVRAHHARVVLLAEDAADNSVRRAGHLAQGTGTPVTATPFSKAELGGAVGRSACAMLALTEPGLAHAVVARLSQADPERYGALAAELSGQAQRALERQKEQRRHERNLRRKKAPWAAPPPSQQAPARQAGAKQGKPVPKAGPKKGAAPRGGRPGRKKTP